MKLPVLTVCSSILLLSACGGGVDGPAPAQADPTMLSVPAQAQTPSPAPLPAPAAIPNEQIEVAAGAEFSLTVPGQPGAAEAWRVEGALDPLLLFLSHDIIPTAGAGLPAGTAEAAERFTFKALGAGVATLVLEVPRPLDTDPKAVARMQYTITIR